MPKVGLSRPYIADYHSDGAGTVTYKNGHRAGRAVSYTLTAESGSANDFYSDNGISESAGGTFTKGSVSLETAELEQTTSMCILGTKTVKMQVGDETVYAQVYDDTMKAGYKGFGVIVKNIIHGVTKWRAVVLPRVQWAIPEDAATTQGESIEWQTDTITGTVLRDETASCRWKIDAVFDTEAKADAFICHVLGITDAELDTLTVVSAEGSTSGTTKITVTPELSDGRSYRYKIGTEITLPQLYADLNSWQTWDGVSDITAESGDTIVLAEVDQVGHAMAAGSTTVTAKGEE